MATLAEIGLVQAFTEAIGEADAEIGGFRLTRTTAVVAKGTDLVGAYQWPGGSATPQVVLVNDTSDVVVGDWIGFRTDDQMWEIDLIVPNTSVRLLNPNGLIYPTDAGVGTSSKAVTTIPVETTHEWSDAGKIALDGVAYSYAAKTATSFTGITHVAGGATVVGTAMAHRDETTVVDITREWSALDLVRLSMLVNHAEDEYLSNLGRNLGVPRLPLFESDDQYRSVIKALAYNPRGTMFGLELAMDALVGAGNYELYEDLMNFPCTVFVRLTAGYTGTESAGKAFLTGPGWDGLAGAQDALALSATPKAVEGVVLHAMDELFDFRSAKPSAVTYDYYPGVGAPGNAFTYAGAEAEGTGVTLVAGSYNIFKSTAGATVFYRMTDIQGARITEESFVEISLLMYIPAVAARKAGEYKQASIGIYDGNYQIWFGVDTVNAGLFKTMVGGFLGSTFVFADDTWYDVTVRKYSNRFVELWVNGQFITRVDYSLFNTATANHRIEFGIQGAPNLNMEMWTKQIGIAHRTPTDYWNGRGLVGTVAAANPSHFDANEAPAFFVASDVGKRLRIHGSVTPNPSGGNNNGVWYIVALIGAPPTNVVWVIGDYHADAVDILDVAGHPRRLTADDPEAFTFPDDLGKVITISGSAFGTWPTGNNDTYIVTKLLNPGTLDDLAADYDTELLTKTNVCEVNKDFAETESGLDYNLVPVFANEAGLDWELSDAGSFVGTALTLRQGLWVNGLIMEMRFSDVLTAQLMAASVVMNAVIQASPLLYEVYPFYLADPLGLVRAYLDAITAAGVIPDYGISS